MNESTISKQPGVCGGSACVQGTRIPVWVLVRYQQLGLTDEAILKQYPTLTQASLDAAWEYNEQYHDEIEKDLDEERPRLVDKIESIAFHRNGVGGVPFEVVLFTSEAARMIAIVWNESGGCAVLNRDLVAQGNVAFMENSFRGDCFEFELKTAIRAWWYAKGDEYMGDRYK